MRITDGCCCTSASGSTTTHATSHLASHATHLATHLAAHFASHLASTHARAVKECIIIVVAVISRTLHVLEEGHIILLIQCVSQKSKIGRIQILLGTRDGCDVGVTNSCSC